MNEEEFVGFDYYSSGDSFKDSSYGWSQNSTDSSVPLPDLDTDESFEENWILFYILLSTHQLLMLGRIYVLIVLWTNFTAAHPNNTNFS